jgi:hypothetical protein
MADRSLKQGHSCFGCCCDMRRAVIIVNIFVVILYVASMIFVAIAVPATKNSDNADPDYSDSEINSALVGVIVSSLIGILFSMFAIFGAIRYNIWLVGANIAYLIISFIAVISVNVAASNSNPDYTYNVWFNVVFGLIIRALFIYPHVMFIREVRSGIMTKENYSEEEQSCCCV